MSFPPARTTTKDIISCLDLFLTNTREAMETMPTIKQTALHAIENLPEDVDYDDIMEALYVQQKIAKGIQQLDEGKYVTHEQVKERVKKWSK